jgi:small-conductance mechanosensitive channel
VKISKDIYNNGLKVFLIFCGLSLFIAWLPDIIVSIINKKSLELIEIYTTQITYVLDMGIISPLIFICLFNLTRNNKIGYVLLGIILTILLIIGIMLPIQTMFQIMAGINLPIGTIISKVGIFVILALVAIYYEIKLFKNI